MRLPLFIARRYFLSRYNTGAINIISMIAMSGIAVGTMALIVVLSVFNGFQGLVSSLYNSFYPDVRITAVAGKTFVPDSLKFIELRRLPGVQSVSEVVEENALLRYRDKEFIAVIKGVDDAYRQVTRLDKKIVRGQYLLRDDEHAFAVLGSGVELFLGVNVESGFAFLNVYVPRRGRVSGLMLEQAFNHDIIYPAGAFSIQQDFDSRYVIVPIGFARSLLEYSGEVSALEIKLRPGTGENGTLDKIRDIWGERFDIKDRYRQNEFLYKLMRTERWIVYAVLTLILLLAAFNIIGSLAMLVIEKRRDISVLKSMGAGAGTVRRIFTSEGFLISFTGACAGTALAVILCVIQQRYELLKIPGQGTFVISAYPVEMRTGDFILVFATVMAITALASWYPARKAALQAGVWKEE